MASVYCTATGWRTDRRFRRGYRLADDRCEICGARLTRKRPDPDPVGPDECGSHACVGKHVKLVDRGLQRRRVWTGTALVPGPARHHFHDLGARECPACGMTYTYTIRSWTEAVDSERALDLARRTP